MVAGFVLSNSIGQPTGAGRLKAKTIGIVGGIGPESTVDYYRIVLRAFADHNVDDYRSILINSIDLRRVLGFLNADDRPGLTDIVATAIEELARAGAELALFASNTPHLVFDEIQSRSPIPLVSIVTATCDAARERGLERVGLIGTRFTMNGGFYTRYFADRGISVVVPDAKDQEYIHEKYLNEIVPGVFRDETRAGVLAVLNRLREQQHIDGVILGGTELPLLLRGVDYDLPLLDTARIHVEAAVRQAVQPSP